MKEMIIDFTPLLAFVFIATFTPGPGNIASAAMGMMYGYRRSLCFLSGIVAGYFMVMTFCAFLSSKLLTFLPEVEPVLRVIGAGYILWMARNTIGATNDVSEGNLSPMCFRHGFLLQALNPKAVVFGLTIYTTFLAGITGHPLAQLVSTVFFAVLTFCSVSIWALGGVQIQKYLHLEGVRKWIDFILFGLLVYCAVTLSGIF